MRKTTGGFHNFEFLNNASSVFIGQNAGDAATSGNTYGTYIGHYAGANSTGPSNVYIGWNTGLNNSTGSNNTFVGTNAGASSSGYGHVFIGYRAGQNATGSQKLYIENSNSETPLIYGEFVNNLVRINGTLDINDAFTFPTVDGSNGQVLSTDGSGALSWTTLTDSDNQDLSLSGNSLSLTNDATPVDLSDYDNANTTLVQDADNDTKIQVEESDDDDVIRFDVSGGEAFTISKNVNGITLLQPDNTTNTILGKFAGLNTNTDDYNTFIGYRAGEDNANYDNTFIGALAGASSTGFHNLFIGAGTGESATGNGNIFIGYETGYNSSGSNQLYIDNSDTPSPLIYGEFDNDLLRINGMLNINNSFTFPTADGTNGQVLSTDGSGALSWTTLTDSDNQDLSLSGNSLNLTNDATPVDLSGYLDNTDAQSLSLSSNTLSLTNGGSVDLSGYIDNTDAQTLSLNSNTLSLTNGGSVDLGGYLDNTDQQDLSLSGNSLTLTNDATPVDLSAYLDNTDAQALSLNSNTLSLTNGGSVDLSLYQQSISLNGTTKTLHLSNGGSADLTNYFNENTVLIQDADNDTKIQVEESADEDVIRFDVGGSEVLSISSNANGVPRLSIPGANTLISGGNNVSTGNKNTFLGQGSGVQTTSGSENTYLGVRTGFLSNGSGNVFIGYEAGYNETNSNRLYIDNSNTSSPLIYGEFDNNLVKINGTAQVAGETTIDGNLKADGGLRVQDGSQGAGKILTSDANGNASWEEPANRVATAWDTSVQAVDGSAQSSWLRTSDYTNYLSVESGDVVIVSATFNARLIGGSGNDNLRYQFEIDGDSGCPDIFGGNTGNSGVYQLNRGLSFHIPMQYAFTASCSGTYRFAVQTDFSATDDDFEMYQVSISAVKY